MCCKFYDTSKVKDLFAGWQETLIYSCLQKVMGSIYVTNPDEPVSALAYVGCFGFVAGEPNRELLENKPEGFAIITPQNEAWAALIEEVYLSVRKVTRDFVSSFTDKKQYLGLGRGIVILKDDKIVSGASSYTRPTGCRSPPATD